MKENNSQTVLVEVTRTRTMTTVVTEKLTVPVTIGPYDYKRPEDLAKDFVILAGKVGHPCAWELVSEQERTEEDPDIKASVKITEPLET